MKPDRLTFALDSGAFAAPQGRVLVMGARADRDYAALGGQLDLVTPHYPDHARLAARGLSPHVAPPGEGYDTALVHVVKSKPRTLAMLAEAAQALAPGGRLIVDGQKTEGVESILKALRKVMVVEDVVSKAHGKLFWAHKTGSDTAAMADWRGAPQEVEGGYVTLPGIFSADGPDQGSELLIALVPALSGRVADFGAGWGYLAGEILKEQAGIERMTLIEADRDALDCAAQNITDPRADCIWGDVTTHSADQGYDAIISNPPFHQGRDADPDLGRAFIAAAARCLRPNGRFYMVANRHLPYESTLKSAFGTGRMLAEMHGYKLYEAAKPKRQRR